MSPPFPIPVTNFATSAAAPSIVTDGIVLDLNASDAASYPGVGLTWTDLVNSAALTFSTEPGYSSSPGFVNLRSVAAAGNYASGTPAAIGSITKGAIEIWFRWKETTSMAATPGGVVMTTGGNWLALGHTAGGGYAESMEFFNAGAGPNYLAMQYVGSGGNLHFKDNQWHQLVIVVVGGGGAGDPTTIYLDGALMPPIGGGPTGVEYRFGSDNSNTLWNAAALTIGHLRTTPVPYYNFDGDIAIVRMYDRDGVVGSSATFSAAEVAQNYAADAAKFAEFHPDTIDSLTLWLDPDDDPTLILTGSDIDVIKDKAFAVDNAGGYTVGASKPTIVAAGGRNWMEFNGVDQYLQAQSNGSSTIAISSLIGTSATGWEMHAVIDADTATGVSLTNPYDNNNIIMDNGGYWGIAAAVDPGDPANVRIQPNAYDGSSNWTDYDIPKNEKHVFGISYAGGASTDLITYIDGVTTTVAAVGASNIPNNLSNVLQLGKGYSALYYNGLIGEVCIFNAPLTPTERANLLAYLAAKWGTP